jgi:hypothetical protein
MALMRPRSSEPAPEPLSALAEDPEFARLLTMRRAFVAEQDDRQRQLDILAIEGELQRPTSPASGQRIQLLRERVAAMRLVSPAPKQDTPSPDGLPQPIARALALLAGDIVQEPDDREARLKRLRSDQRILELALAALEPLIEDVRADRSLAVAVRLKPAHQAVLRDVWAAAAALATAIEAERRLFASVLIAGYTDRPDILMRPALNAALRLGALSEYDSEISWFRRRLEDQGVL